MFLHPVSPGDRAWCCRVDMRQGTDPAVVQIDVFGRQPSVRQNAVGGRQQVLQLVGRRHGGSGIAGKRQIGRAHERRLAKGEDKHRPPIRSFGVDGLPAKQFA